MRVAADSRREGVAWQRCGPVKKEGLSRKGAGNRERMKPSVATTAHMQHGRNLQREGGPPSPWFILPRSCACPGRSVQSRILSWNLFAGRGPFVRCSP